VWDGEEGTVTLTTLIMMIGIILTMLTSIIPSPLSPPSPLTSLQAYAYTTPDNRLIVSIVLKGVGMATVTNVTLESASMLNCTLTQAYVGNTPTSLKEPWVINTHRSLTLVFTGPTCLEVEAVVVRFNNGVVLQAGLIG
jgi:hypothetical protein